MSNTKFNQRFKDLIYNGEVIDRMVITRIRSLSRILNTKTADANFQQEGKRDLAKYFLNILQRIGESSGEHFCSGTTRISSGLVALEGSRVAITSASILLFMLRWVKSVSVLGEYSGSMCPESSRVELLLNSLAKSFTLFPEEERTSVPLKSGGSKDLPLFEKLL